MGKSRDREMALIWIVEAIDRALEEYDSDNVDVVKNEETSMLDIIYHSDNNSFAIQADVFNYKYLNEHDKGMLVRELDKRHVGYCW